LNPLPSDATGGEEGLQGTIAAELRSIYPKRTMNHPAASCEEIYLIIKTIIPIKFYLIILVKFICLIEPELL
ncbi:hypothetical protein, partial [Salmonella enterica]|uniref:hypothetical protein n=1 Tax=Salmonella enterica TaxID=28901 RepID=UPI001BB0423F